MWRTLPIITVITATADPLGKGFAGADPEGEPHGHALSETAQCVPGTELSSSQGWSGGSHPPFGTTASELRVTKIQTQVALNQRSKEWIPPGTPEGLRLGQHTDIAQKTHLRCLASGAER